MLLYRINFHNYFLCIEETSTLHCEVKPMPNVVRLLNVCGKYKNLKQYGKKKTHKIEKRSNTADN